MSSLFKTKPPYIAPSLLSADFGNLERDIHMINESKADLFHIDIMDGVFVPNLSFGFPVLDKIHAHARKPLDVHLMIVDPDRYVERFREGGAEIITVHYEACNHLHRTIQHIRSTGAMPGVSLNPHTPVALLEDIIHELDLVLIMSVNPGYGGQKFIENSYKKVKELKKMKELYNPELLIEVDGGVNTNNGPKLLYAGADILVAGNTVFSSPDPAETIELLKM
jgi:ribulose-phosphate 3-epimerase